MIATFPFPRYRESVEATLQPPVPPPTTTSLYERSFVCEVDIHLNPSCGDKIFASITE